MLRIWADSPWNSPGEFACYELASIKVFEVSNLSLVLVTTEWLIYQKEQSESLHYVNIYLIVLWILDYNLNIN